MINEQKFKELINNPSDAQSKVQIVILFGILKSKSL